MSRGDHYNTPWWVLEPIYDFAGYFSLDPCWNARSLVPADHLYGVKEDGLAQPWFGKVFYNPPYSRGNLWRWTQKAIWEYETGATDESFGLVPADTSAGWLQEAMPRASALLFYKRRIRFVGAPGTPKFPSALLYHGPRPVAFEMALGHLGTVIRAGSYKPAPPNGRPAVEALRAYQSLLHPHGRCTCAGAGRCAWCRRVLRAA